MLEVLFMYISSVNVGSECPSRTMCFNQIVIVVKEDWNSTSVHPLDTLHHSLANGITSHFTGPSYMPTKYHLATV